MTGPLHEREAELALIDKALADAAAGESALLVVSGGVGIGRSALLHAAAARAGDDVLVLRAAGAELEQDFDHELIRQLLEPLLIAADDAHLRRWFAGAAALVAPLFGVDLPQNGAADSGLSGTDRVTLGTELHGLWTLLAALSEQQPLLLVLDDLHWADAESLRLLAYLTNRWPGIRATVLVSVRDGDPRLTHPLVDAVLLGATATLCLAPLSTSGVAAALDERFGGPDAEFTEFCAELTAGNPLLVHATTTAMTIADLRPVPSAIEQVRTAAEPMTRERIAAGLRQQSERVRGLAVALSVLDGAADDAMLAALAGFDQVEYAQAVAEASALGLFGRGTPPSLDHPAVRAAADSLLSMAEREDRHEQAATLLSLAGRPATVVAAHLMKVTNCAAPWVRPTLRAAAREAVYQRAPRAAASYLRRALLTTSVDSEERGRLLLELVAVERGFAPVEAQTHLCQAIPLLPDAVARASALVGYSPTFPRISPGPLDDLVRSLAAELDSDAGRGDGLEHGGLLLRVRARVSPLSGPDDRLSAAVAALADPGYQPPVAAPADRELLAVLLDSATQSASVSAARVAELGKRLIEHEPAAAEHVYSTVPFTITSLIAADATDTLGPWLDQAQQHAQRANLPYAQLLIHLEQALVMAARGRLVLARVHVGAAQRLTTVDNGPAAELMNFAQSVIALQSDDRDFAESVLRRGQVWADDPVLGGTASLLRGLLAANRGEWHAALENFLSCGRRLRGAGWRNCTLLPWSAGAIMMYQQLGNREAAFALLEEEYEQTLAWGAPNAVGRLQRVRGQLTEGSAGIALLRESGETLRASGNLVELFHTMRLLGERLDDDAIRRQAQSLRLQCGLSGSSTGAAERAVADEAAQPTAELTKSEQRVVALAVTGLSNQQIADELSVSLRAVEKHLTKSYRKLQVSGRSELRRASLRRN